MSNPRFAYDNFDCGLGVDKDFNFKKGGGMKTARRKLFSEKCPSIFYRSKIVISGGFSRINKLISSLKHKIECTSQNFRLNGFRRYGLNEYDSNSSPFHTPSQKVHHILGRTPIKLYSPFGIETPARFQ